jgi:hypothetical protein
MLLSTALHAHRLPLSSLHKCPRRNAYPFLLYAVRKIECMPLLLLVSFGAGALLV